MFGIFNNKASRAAKNYPLSREAGEKGLPADVHAAAQRDGSWDTKENLVQGCVAAFEKGHADNLRAFVMGYLEFKRAGGAVDKIETSPLDDGLVGLICKPVLHLLERQQHPAKVLETLTSAMSPYYKQLLLDVVLRHACVSNSWMVVPVLLEAGADVNTGRGRPLLNAARAGHVKIVTLLLQAGANIESARALTNNENKDPFEKSITACTGASAPTATPVATETVLQAPTLTITPAGRSTIKKPTGPDTGNKG